VILGTAGHIDHGKTALVKALTGVDADRLPEEKRRGITIDLGFAPLVIDDIGTIGIVDVPGHEGFVRTMLAGASGVDLAMLVVAADEGVMPQTREHLEILSLLQIPHGVIALTKCDIADEDWRVLVAEDIRKLCENTPLANAELIEVSALTGENIDGLKAAIGRAAREVKKTRVDDVFRLPVDRAFTVKGTGTVVTGTVWSGTARKDDIVRIEPAGKTARIRAVQSHGHAVDLAQPGTRTALALAGCDVDDVTRGSTIVSEQAWVPSTKLDVSLTMIDKDLELTARTRVRVHIGTADAGARLSRLRVGDDTHLYARLVLDEPMIARGGDRFVIRLPSPPRTIGGGEVIDPYPSRRQRAQPNKPSTLLHGSKVQRMSHMLDAAGAAGIQISLIPIRTGVKPHEVTNLLRDADAMIVGDVAVAAESLGELEKLLEHFVSLYMANHPLEAGVSLQTLRAAAKAHELVIELALDRLEKKGRITLDRSTVRPSGWDSKLDQREQAVSDSILHDICTGASEPPSVGELEAKFGKNTGALLRRLERQGEIERVSADRYYGRESVLQMVGALRERLEPERQYSPAELKEVLGVSRKYLIPFLEFCDRKGVTERGSEGRHVKGAAGSKMNA
jgi:selenocysteine-specific elongation factor